MFPGEINMLILKELMEKVKYEETYMAQINAMFGDIYTYYYAC